MRRAFVLGVLLGLAACGGEDAAAPPPQPPTPPAPVATVETPPPAPTATEAPPAPKPTLAELEMSAIKSYPSILTDPTKVSALYTPDASFFIAGKPPLTGREAIQKSAQDFNEQIASPAMSISRVWVKGNVVAFAWQLTGTEKGSGKAFGLEGATLLTFNDDGLITKDHSYVDHVTLMKQTGAYKGDAPPRAPAALSSGTMEVHTSKGDATEDANVATSKTLTTAWIAGDAKSMLDKFTDDYVFEDYTDQASAKKADLEKILKASFKATGDRKVTDTTLFGAEDFTIDEQEGAMTQKGEFVLGKVKIPNKKKTLTFHALEIDQWKDGKVVKSWSWSSGLEVASQLGIGPAAPGAAKKADAKPDAKPDAKKDEKKPEPAKAAPKK